MSNYSLYWIPLILITLGIGLWFTYLYLKEKDKRKLMFALAFYTSVISFSHLAIGYYRYNADILGQNVFNWMSMPIVLAISIAVNESLFKLKKFDSAFNLFLGLFFICFIMIVIPYNFRTYSTMLRIIIALQIIVVSSYFLYKNKDLSNLLFLFSMFCFSIAGYSLTYGQVSLSIFAFLMANIFICLVFIESFKSDTKNKYAMDSYFSLKNKLKGTKLALLETEQRYKRIVDNTSDVIMLTNPEGIISFISPAAEKVLGYKPRELVGKQPWIIHLDDLQKVKDLQYNALRGKSGKNSEYRIKTKTGEIRWVSHSWSPIMKNNKLQQIVSSIRDISSRKSAEMEIEKRTHDLGERVKELNCLYGIANLVEDTNNSLENILHCTVKLIPSAWQFPDITCARITVRGRNYVTNNFEETEWKQSSDIIINGNKQGVVEVYYKEEKKTSNEGPFQKEERELIDAIADQLKGIVERKNMEKELKKYTETLEEEVKQRTNELIQSEKMSSLGQLVAGVAHEINNPLAYLKSNTEFLGEYIEDIKDNFDANGFKFYDEMMKLINSNIDGTDRIATITKTLKQFAKPDFQEKASADVNQGLKDTLIIVHNHLKHRVNVHEEYGILPNIKCILGQINQVFMNLIMNASQAMESGDIWINTWTSEKEVNIEIRDNGDGIPEDSLNNIFDPFYTTKTEGTGLGLSLVYNIIKAHDGEIKVESNKGVGTSFKIKLPIEG